MYPMRNTVTDYHPWQWPQPPGEIGHDYQDYPGWPDPAMPISADDTLETGVSQTVRAFWGIASTVGAVSGAYHGYKRNQSVGWAVGWFFFGAIMPILSIPIMLAEGFAERK